VNRLMRMLFSMPYRDEEGGEGGAGGAGEAAAAAAAAAAAEGGEAAGEAAAAAAAAEGGDPPAPTWAGTAPEDWRAQLAGDNEANLAKLGRYTDFNSFVKSSFDVHEKARQGLLSTGLPEGATEDQVKEYREANGIPADGKYELSLDKGLELTESDIRIMESVMPVALAGNIGTAELSAITSAFVQGRNVEFDKMIEKDGLESQQIEQTLRDNWGNDFAANSAAVENLLTRELPEDVRKLFTTGRDGEGKALMNNPHIVSMLANLERTINPMVGIPGGGENANKTADDIIAEANKLQRAGEKYPSKEFEQQYLTALDFKLKQKQQQEKG
jgi:peptidoglycan hydrolase-like protein with peptidoglycan-binding domain